MTLANNSGSDDIFIAQITSDGIWNWAIRAGGLIDVGRSITSMGNGTALVTGYFSGTADFGGLNLVSNNATSDIFIAKIRSDGTWEWAKQVGDSGGSGNYGYLYNINRSQFSVSYG